MNTEEINHLLKHILANSRACFLGVFASDKLAPLNTIHSLVQCCYVSNIDPTGQGGTHWVSFFHSRQNRLGMEDKLVNLAFPFHSPFKYLIIHINPGLRNPGLLAVLHLCSLSSSSQLCIEFNM